MGGQFSEGHGKDVGMSLLDFPPCPPMPECVQLEAEGFEVHAAHRATSDPNAPVCAVLITRASTWQPPWVEWGFVWWCNDGARAITWCPTEAAARAMYDADFQRVFGDGS